MSYIINSYHKQVSFGAYTLAGLPFEELSMYCPNCGANNQDEVKFCTRCGTNLGVVSEALTGKTAGKTGTDARIAKLTTDYYRGRRDTITGAVLIPAGVLIMAILVAAGMHAIGAFFIICWMFFWQDQSR